MQGHLGYPPSFGKNKAEDKLMSNQTQATLQEKGTLNEGVLYMAIEMGEKSWKLLFSSGEMKSNGQLRVYQKGIEGNNLCGVGRSGEQGEGVI
jgi:hypothetical protein